MRLKLVKDSLLHEPKKKYEVLKISRHTRPKSKHVEETSNQRREKVHLLQYNCVDLKSEMIDSQKDNANLHKVFSDYQGFKIVQYNKVRKLSKNTIAKGGSVHE